MKISTLDRITNKMVEFDSMNELIEFRAKQERELSQSKEVTVVKENKLAKRFIFSITVEGDDEIDATLACEAILLREYEVTNGSIMDVFDVREIVKEIGK